MFWKTLCCLMWSIFNYDKLTHKPNDIVKQTNSLVDWFWKGLRGFQDLWKIDFMNWALPWLWSHRIDSTESVQVCEIHNEVAFINY